MTSAPQSGDRQIPVTPPPAPPPLAPSLWSVVALGFVPVCFLAFFQGDWGFRPLSLIFVAGVGINGLRLRHKWRVATASAFTGAVLFPVLSLLYAVTAAFFRYTGNYSWIGDIFTAVLWFPIVGLILGFFTGKLFEAAFFLSSSLWSRRRRGISCLAASESRREQMDEASTPLDCPPMYGLPRRFGIRGLLIVVTWASVVMGILRALHAPPIVFFLVLTFVSGVLVSQVLLFLGRDPFKASMWAGAFLLVNEMLVLGCFEAYKEPNFSNRFVAEFAEGCFCLVPAGIALGAVSGFLCGLIYTISDWLLLWIFRGLPTIELRPIAEADIDVLLAWISGPRLCKRWAGDQLKFPLDRDQLLQRFDATSGEKPVRRIYKAVDLRTGGMVGYVEIGRIDQFYRGARLELPLVDPDASERGRLGVALLRKSVEKAFRELGLLEISLVSPSGQSEDALCFARAWKMDYEFYSFRKLADGMWIGKIRQMMFRPSFPSALRSD